MFHTRKILFVKFNTKIALFLLMLLPVYQADASDKLHEQTQKFLDRAKNQAGKVAEITTKAAN